MPRDEPGFQGCLCRSMGSGHLAGHRITAPLSFLCPPLPGPERKWSLGQMPVVILSILDARGKRHSSLEADGSDLTLC